MKRSDPETLRAAFEIVRAYVLLQLFADRIVSEHGIETYEMHLMFRLRDEGPLTQAALGRALLRDPMSVSRLVRSLESRRLVRRSERVGDARAWLVGLTPRGEQVLRRVLLALKAGAPLRGWSRDDVRSLRSLLERAVVSFREACERGGIASARRDVDDTAQPTGRGRMVRIEAEEPVPTVAKRRRR